jgi:cation diffusion facilitator family transporter
MDKPTDLTRYAWLSIAAAVVTIGLKTTAWYMTGSVGLLADAAESLVNLFAAIMALVALTVSMKPADKNHHFGHSKAEYFSAAIEGLMIFIAAAFILISSINRFFNPEELQNVGVGLVVSAIAAVVNGVVGVVLIRVGNRHRSITLTADGKHLMTDVWTSAGVIIGVLLVALTGWTQLDAIVAFAVGVNILVTGWKLITQSTAGFMDVSLPKADNKRIRAILDEFRSDEIQFHAIRTREAGRRRFMTVHVLVPGTWTIQQGHALTENINDAVQAEYPELHIICHVEPIEDPRSYEDIEL